MTLIIDQITIRLHLNVKGEATPFVIEFEPTEYVRHFATEWNFSITVSEKTETFGISYMRDRTPSVARDMAQELKNILFENDPENIQKLANIGIDSDSVEELKAQLEELIRN